MIQVEQATIQRVTTIDTKGGGFAILLTTTNNISETALVELMRGRGSVMKLTLERVQLSLLEGDDPNAGVPPVTERVWETTSGDVVRAHPYESSAGGVCDTCGHSEGHEAHQVTPEAVQKLADKLLQDEAAGVPGGLSPDVIVDDSRITPEQAEAREALRSRSRSNRNGG